MKITKISMAIIAATAVLAISPAVMAQSTNQAAPGAQAPRGGGRTNMMTVESIDKAVTLTDAEKPKVKTALEEYTKAATEARQADQSERRTKMTAAVTDLDKKMKEILTPDQYTKFQAMPRPGRRGQGGGGGGGNGGGGAGGAGGAPAN
jgi:periplasmic protein CpxP/Spy